MSGDLTKFRDYADEHLLYEIWMTSTLTARMSRHPDRFDGGLSAAEGPLARELLELTGRNADIESFALHVRNLVKFLYAKRPKQGDVVAASYFDVRNDWFDVRPDLPKSLNRVNARVPVEIVHLSVGRLKVRESDKTWPYELMWRDLAKVIGVFLDRVPENRLSAEFCKTARALLPGSSTEELRHIVTKVDEISRAARAGVTEMETATYYPIMDDDSSAAGTATMPPKLEPPGFGD
jgi:hypothetical protein